MKNFVSLFSLLIIAFSLSAQLSGVYTINNALPSKKANFSNFTEAVNALRFQGLDGDVTFLIASGDYYEPLVFEGIGEELEYSISFMPAENGTVRFINDGIALMVSNSNNIKFSKLSFESTSTEISNMVILSNASKIVIENNEFITKVSSLNDKSVVSLTSTSTNNIINRNRIVGASGIELNRMSGDNFIAANEIYFLKTGIEVFSSLNNTIFSNQIMGKGELGQVGIQIDGYVGAVDIASNSIENTQMGMFQTLTFRPSESKLSGRIVNNIIVSEGNTIELSNNIQDLKIAYNSFTSAKGTVLILKDEIKGTVTGIDLYANNLLNQSDFPVLFVSKKSILGHVDYNNIYNEMGNFTTNVEGVVITSLAQWKESMLATHAISADPLYVTVNSKKYMLSENSPCIDAGPKATNIGVLTDYDGDARGEKTEIGADEFNKTAYESMIQMFNLALD